MQQDIGSFLFYARAIDMTILLALNAIAGAQAAPTTITLKRVHQLLVYMATNPNAIVRFRASDIVLNVHSDASYLSAPKARNRAGGYYFLAASQNMVNQFNSMALFMSHVQYSNLLQHLQQEQN